MVIGPIGDGEIAPIAWAALDKSPLFLAQLGFAAFGDLQGIAARGLDVEGHLEGQEVGEGLDRQAIRHQRDPLRLHQEQRGGDGLGEERGQRAE